MSHETGMMAGLRDTFSSRLTPKAERIIRISSSKGVRLIKNLYQKDQKNNLGPRRRIRLVFLGEHAIGFCGGGHKKGER